MVSGMTATRSSSPPGTRADVRAGVDVGGTFTDVVAYDERAGEIRVAKVPTETGDAPASVVHALARVERADAPARSLAHGTTIVTNAIVEGRLAPVGLIATRGFRDVLEIARMNRAHLYRLDLRARPAPLVPRHRRREITERVGPDGRVHVALAIAEIPAVIDALAREGVDAVAVALLHSYANPAHERALRQPLERRFAHVCVSSDINAEFREYERTATTVLNAGVMPLAARYLDGLTAALARPIHLLHSAGGMMSVAAAKVRPLALAMSGPAAGVAAAAFVADTLGLSRALAFDMGGTTTDVCLVTDGVAETAAERRIGDHPVRLPSVAVESIGAGGGSIARVDEVGALKVGPQSAGATPGPACYGQGGTEPTVTDANLVLGYLPPDRVYGGSIRLDPARAREAVRVLGQRLGLSAVEAAHGIVEVANANMLRALRRVSVERGYDLRAFALIAYGGAGPVHAGALARECGIRHVVVPAVSGAFSALGCLVSPLRYDVMQTHRVRLADGDGAPVENRFRDLEAQCLPPLLDEGHRPGRITLGRSVDLRYAGQNYELEVAWADDATALRRAFEARHLQLYGYATGESVECVNLRVSARVLAEPLALPRSEPGAIPVERGRHRAFFPETGELELPTFDRGELGAGVSIAGPALIEDAWSTTLVYPGQHCRVHAAGHLLIEVAA
jgi:N-methylhydantoinase A